MWSIVEAKQKLSRRRKRLLNTRTKHVDTGPVRALSFTPQATSALARDLLRACQALREIIFVRRDVLLPVRHYLSECVKNTTCVHLVALGVGPFSRQESCVGFIQMALFLAMKIECENTLRELDKSIEVDMLKDHIVTPAGLEAAVSSCKGHNTLVSSFFDPKAGELHTRCCEKLGIAVDKENRYGAYMSGGSQAPLIVYLPHAPWVLLYNLFVSNIIPCQGDKDVDHLERLRFTLVIGNDLREKMGSNNDIVETLVPYLRFHEVRARNRKSRTCNDNDVDSMSSNLSNGLKGVSRSDVCRAFSDTAVMQLNTERETELWESLRGVIIPPAVREGPDME